VQLWKLAPIVRSSTLLVHAREGAVGSLRVSACEEPRAGLGSQPYTPATLLELCRAATCTRCTACRLAKASTTRTSAEDGQRNHATWRKWTRLARGSLVGDHGRGFAPQHLLPDNTLHSNLHDVQGSKQDADRASCA